MRVLLKSSNDNHPNTFVCVVDYDLQMEQLIRGERMGKIEKARVIKYLSQYKDKRGQKSTQQVTIGLFKPVEEIKLGTVLDNICEFGRPVTLREAMSLCHFHPKIGLKKKIVVISRDSCRQPTVSLAYWFGGAWRLNTFASNRIWKQTYPYEFAYVPK